MWRSEVNTVWFSQLLSTSCFGGRAVHWTWKDSLLDRLASKPSGSFCLSTFPGLGLQVCATVCSWGLDLESHDCKKIALPTEPSLSLCSLNSLKHSLPEPWFYVLVPYFNPLFPCGTLLCGIIIIRTKDTFYVNKEMDDQPKFLNGLLCKKNKGSWATEFLNADILCSIVTAGKSLSKSIS